MVVERGVFGCDPSFTERSMVALVICSFALVGILGFLGCGSALLDMPAIASSLSSLIWLASMAFLQAVRGVSGAGRGEEVAGWILDLTVPCDSL